MEVGRFQRSIAANRTTYGIYEVYISAVGHQTTEIGNLSWKFSRPMVMYSLREAPGGDSVSTEADKRTH
jgi:hypothetical protein